MNKSIKKVIKTTLSTGLILGSLNTLQYYTTLGQYDGEPVNAFKDSTEARLKIAPTQLYESLQGLEDGIGYELLIRGAADYLRVSNYITKPGRKFAYYEIERKKSLENKTTEN